MYIHHTYLKVCFPLTTSFPRIRRGIFQVRTNEQTALCVSLTRNKLIFAYTFHFRLCISDLFRRKSETDTYICISIYTLRIFVFKSNQYLFHYMITIDDRFGLLVLISISPSPRGEGGSGVLSPDQAPPPFFSILGTPNVPKKLGGHSGAVALVL